MNNSVLYALSVRDVDTILCCSENSSVKFLLKTILQFVCWCLTILYINYKMENLGMKKEWFNLD